MLRVTATGMINGNEIEVDAELKKDRWILSEPFLQHRFDMLLDKDLPIGGTYYPEKGSLLAAHNILENHFFDKLIRIEPEGELEKIPFEENVIY